MKLFFSIFALVMFLSCSSTKNVPVNPSAENLEISLVKGGCFGKCPIYEFNIYKGGYCEFIGQQNIDRIGKYTKTLTKEKYKEVQNAFEESDYQRFDDNYESNIPDLPTILLVNEKGLKDCISFSFY